jgi:hypothetical protein
MQQLSLFPPLVQFDHGRIQGPLPEDAPVIVSNGVGANSMAMLLLLHRLGITPDAIVTALVGRGRFGNEHRRFYDYLPNLDAWLTAAGFPAPAFVWYQMKRPAKHFAYASLAGNCLANRTLPSISFRRNHSCSLKFKGAEIDRWVTEQYGGQACYRLVGYHAGEKRRGARFCEQTNPKGPRSRDIFVHPLQLLGLDRQACAALIREAGLPMPGKSSCVFCASMQPSEIDELHPEELWLIVILEAHAQINLKKISGLWGHQGRMTDYILRRRLLPPDLVRYVWTKWSARERPPELCGNPEANADEVLFTEVRRWTALSHPELLGTEVEEAVGKRQSAAIHSLEISR